MTEDQADEQASARGCERKAGATKSICREWNSDLSDHNAQHCRKRKGGKPCTIKGKELFAILLFFCRSNGQKKGALFFHIRLFDARDELNKEYLSNNAKDVSNAVSNRHKPHILKS